MKEIKDMTLAQIELFDEVMNYKRARGPEVVNITNLITTFIDKKANVCGKCSAQIKFAHKRVINWYNFHKVEIEARREELLQETPGTLDSKTPGTSTEHPTQETRICNTENCTNDITSERANVKYCKECRTERKTNKDFKK